MKVAALYDVHALPHALTHVLAEVERENVDAIVLRLFVAKDDVGKVIGRQGRIARALRQLVRAASRDRRRRVVLEIVD